MSQIKDFESIDDLFAAARQQETALADDNFTKLVMNQLPAAPRRINRQRLSLDIIATVMAGLAALYIVDFKAIVANLFQGSVSASVAVVDATVLSGSGLITLVSSFPFLTWGLAMMAISLLSLIAWTLVEKPAWLR